jgi:hypothetical protein
MTIRLAEPVEGYRPVGHAGQGRDAQRLAGVLEAAVDLIGQDDEVVLDGQGRQAAEVVIGQDRPGRVVR